jgi:hypothetical protein
MIETLPGFDALKRKKKQMHIEGVEGGKRMHKMKMFMSE